MKRPIVPAAGALAALVLAACDNPGGVPVDGDTCEQVSSAAYAGEVRLEVGQAKLLNAGASLCLLLPDTGGREYVLAYVDTRAVESARDAREAAFDSFTVGVTDGVSLLAVEQRAPEALVPRAALRPGGGSDVLPMMSLAVAPSTHPTARATPWTAGESFPMSESGDGGAVRAARVWRVYDGWLVVASFEDDTLPTLGATLEVLDAAWPGVRDVGLPLAAAAYGQTPPVTSTRAGQLLVLIRSDMGSATGMAYGAIAGEEVFSWLGIVPVAQVTARTPVSLGSLLFHEMTHAWQRQYLHDSRPVSAIVTGGAGATAWGVEGAATLMQRELARRQAGMSLTANADWVSPGPSVEEGWYAAAFAQPGIEGAFTRGYATSAGLMADLVWRSVAAGEGEDAAVAEVARGAVEGWFGWADDTGLRRPGMTSRMRARLGSGWEPERALLEWTLSHAMDDRTASPVFQAPAFREVGNVPPELFGWRAHATLTAGEGQASTTRRRHGSVGWFALAGAGAFHLSADVSGVRWMIARVR